MKKNYYGLDEETYQTLKLPGVYRITNLENGKIYIGGTVDKIKQRFAAHFSEARRGQHINPHFQSAWNKYGEENFLFEIVEIIFDKDKKYVNEREQWWIDFYESYKPELGYNINRKADRKTFTEEQKEYAARLKNPQGVLVYKTKEDTSPDTIYNVNGFCRDNGYDAPTVFSVLYGLTASYRGMIFRYVDEAKNRGRQKTDYKKYLKKDISLISQDENPKYYVINCVKEIPENSQHLFQYERKELENICRYKLYKTPAESCEWRIWEPNGTTYIISNLRDFAELKGLAGGNLTQVAKNQKNHHKGYRVKQVIEKVRLDKYLKEIKE